MSGKLFIGVDKRIVITLNKAQTRQLDFICKKYGTNMSDSIRSLIKQEAFKLSKEE